MTRKEAEELVEKANELIGSIIQSEPYEGYEFVGPSNIVGAGEEGIMSFKVYGILKSPSDEINDNLSLSKVINLLS